MGRILLMLGTFWCGFLLLRENGGAVFGLEEQVVWALLLPGIYLLSLLMWSSD